MITVIGSINMDLVVETDHVPGNGETTLGTSFSTYFGGKGANQAVAMARLGKEVQMIGACGTDEYGKMALSSLKNENIKTDHIFLFSDETTGIASIIVSDADNRIIVVPGKSSINTQGNRAVGTGIRKKMNDESLPSIWRRTKGQVLRLD